MTTDTAETTGTPTDSAPAGVPVGERVVASVSHVVLGFWSLLVIVPLLWTLMSSFKTSKEIFASPFQLPASWNFDNYVSAWTTQGIGRYFVNTVIVVGSALVIVMVLGAMCAYVLACFSFPGRRVIYYSMLAGLTFPIFMAIVPSATLVARNYVMMDYDVSDEHVETACSITPGLESPTVSPLAQAGLARGPGHGARGSTRSRSWTTCGRWVPARSWSPTSRPAGSDA